MNKRKRKKWLKQHNRYVPNSDLWNLDVTICEFILPRLKEFKRINIAYPGKSPMDTPERWDNALDKMIRAFELLQEDAIDKYWTDDCNIDDVIKKAEADRKEAHEGLQLFADWFENLWI